MRKWGIGLCVPWAIVMAALIGCADNPAKLRYLGDAGMDYYKETATEIEYTNVESGVVGEVMATKAPRAVNDPREDEIRDISLAEAIRLALENSNIVRSRELLTTATRVVSAPQGVTSIYDPAIQESGVLFGGRGLESALSAFDTRWNTSMTWGRDETVQNNVFFSGGLMGGTTLTQETGNFSTSLQKLFGNGGSFAVTHDMNYRGVNAPGQLFPSVYTGAVGAEYRLPLLAGAGTEYTRIAGPIANSFGGITGVNQGVVISRINNDITLADFELSVRNLIRDVEDAYWDLYLQYRLYDTAVKTRNSTLELWRQFKIRQEIGADLRAEQSSEVAEPQAREQYYETQAAAKSALGNIYRSETQLRRLLGLPSNDGQVLRPSDEPPMAEFVPDWEMSLVEALTNRTELRRQKFNIKSLELQLQAAQSLVRPRFDFVSNYRVNAFGDKLLSYDDDSIGSPQGLDSAYETLTQGDQTGWNLGFEMTMDLGFRSAHAQVRNIELRLAKARDTLATQEQDVSHELTVAYQDLATQYASAQANFNRFRASERRVKVLRLREDIDGYDETLRAQLSRAAAESAFYRNLASYAQSIASFHFAKGDLLEFNNVQLTESLWTPSAYPQAVRKAMARSHAIKNPLLKTEPSEFISPGYERVITVEPSEEELSADPELEPAPIEMPDDGTPQLIPLPEGEQPATEPGLETPEPTPYEPPENGTPRNDSAGATPTEVRGATVGQLKPVSGEFEAVPASVDRADFFEAFSSETDSESNEPLELDSERDLLQ